MPQVWPVKDRKATMAHRPSGRCAIELPSSLIACPPGDRSALSRHPVTQDVRGVALAKALEGAVAKLSDPLARDTELARDFLQRHRASTLEPEVQHQHPRVAGREHRQRARDGLAARIALDAARQ